MSHTHSHDDASHSHAGGDHGHTHEILDGPGSFLGREMPIIEGRNWEERAFTIGIGGCVLPGRWVLGTKVNMLTSPGPSALARLR